MVDTQKMYNTWMSQDIEDSDLVEDLLQIKDDESEIYERFYKNLDFGTAGIRGVLGAGTNRMNIYTVGQSTQGLCVYLNRHYENPKVAIAYDSRIKADVFSFLSADIFAANGIEVYIYKELMPTPMLSYAVRELGCSAGINVTASHNPAKYNGYKVYDSTGTQIGPEIADKIKEYIEDIDIFSGVKKMGFDKAVECGKVKFIDDSIIESYYEKTLEQQINRSVAKQAELKMVYTPLNGTGNKPVREILHRIGVSDVVVVKEQEMPDGNFPTCPYPNPEIKEALDLGIKLSLKENADILLATDPDCDRVGIAVNNGGDMQLISGNEVGILLLDYICRERTQQGTMPKNPVAIKSIVSSELAAKVAEQYGVEMRNVLTGFKFIGEQIMELEEAKEVDRFIFAYEESYGYLVGSHVRDKDAVVGSMLIAEMASYYKLKGKTLLDVLDEIYAKYGYFLNVTVSHEFDGAAGMKKMSDIMEGLRENPPKNVGEQKIVSIKDILSSIETFSDGKTATLNMHKSNVLIYSLDNGCSFIVRPSGTEPKIKVYFTTVDKSKANAMKKYDELSTDVNKLLNL